MYKEEEAARDSLKKIMPSGKEISATIDGDNTILSFSMIRFEKMSNSLKAALDAMEANGIANISESGKFTYTPLKKIETEGHQHPHGNIPSGHLVNITIHPDKLAAFTSACESAYNQQIATSPASLTR
jgi:hypothetical protein